MNRNELRMSYELAAKMSDAAGRLYRSYKDIMLADGATVADVVEDERAAELFYDWISATNVAHDAYEKWEATFELD